MSALIVFVMSTSVKEIFLCVELLQEMILYICGSREEDDFNPTINLCDILPILSTPVTSSHSSGVLKLASRAPPRIMHPV